MEVFIDLGIFFICLVISNNLGQVWNFTMCSVAVVTSCTVLMWQGFAVGWLQEWPLCWQSTSEGWTPWYWLVLEKVLEKLWEIHTGSVWEGWHPVGGTWPWSRGRQWERRSSRWWRLTTTTAPHSLVLLGIGGRRGWTGKGLFVVLVYHCSSLLEIGNKVY